MVRMSGPPPSNACSNRSVVVAHAPDLADHVADGGRRHLVVRGDRLPDLVLQAQLPSVQEQVLLVGDVVQGGGVAQDRAPLDADRGAQLVVGEALLRDVAGGAGEGVVDRQAPVEEELPSELDLRPGQRVVGGHRNRRQTERRILDKPDEVHRHAAPLQQAARTGAVLGALVAFLDVAGSAALALVERLPRFQLSAGPRRRLQDDEKRGNQRGDRHARAKTWRKL